MGALYIIPLSTLLEQLMIQEQPADTKVLLVRAPHHAAVIYMSHAANSHRFLGHHVDQIQSKIYLCLL